MMLVGAGRLIALGGAIWRGASMRFATDGRAIELARDGSNRPTDEEREGIELLGASKRLVAIGVGAENVRGCTYPRAELRDGAMLRDGAALRGGGLELPREDRSRAASSPAPKASSARTAA